ncbi:MAG TPA: DUF4184 family protein [Ornithinibacter sp.]|nr:DUF4184 family protein [Ornithinibacter sp.]
MPFTVSHVAAVLPVVGRSGRLPAAALVIGSMTPDYPWFLTRGRTAGFSHSLLGVVTVDLAVGLLAVVLWRRWAQAPVRDLVPRLVGERLPRPPGLVPRDLPWAALGVVLGALTHVVWDSFTHAGRWGVEVVPWLHTEHLGLPGYAWAQYASGLLGLAVLVVWGLRRLAATEADPDGLRSTSGDRRAAWGLVAGGALVGVAAGLLRSAGSAEVALFGAVTFGGAGLAVGVVLACVLWWARVPRPAEVTGSRR